jgi:ATP-dependent HslUV protease ATP-binding subunit HslU
MVAQLSFCLLTEEGDNLVDEESLIKQYRALLETEEVTLDFKEGGISEITKISAAINESIENIGTRRLHTVLEKVLEEINFKASDADK